MITMELREATGWDSDRPKFGTVDTNDALTAEEVYCLAVDARPGVGRRGYEDCAAGTGETVDEAEAACAEAKVEGR